MTEGIDFVTTDRTAMTMVSTHGATFEAEWASQKSAIDAGAAAIGHGRLARPFRGFYTAAEQPLKLAADQVPGICQACADVGHRSADDVENEDRNMARGFDLR